MELFWRTVVLVICVAILLLFFRSIVTTALLNLGIRDPIARVLTPGIRGILARFLRAEGSYERFRRVMVWSLPLYLFSLIITWFVMVILSLAGINWAVGSEHTFLDALIASGSALSTLGFATPSNVQGQLLAIFEGALGLGIIVFLFTFIPGYQATIQERDGRLHTLFQRAGNPASSTTLIEWFYQTDNADQLRDTLEAIESWFWEQERSLTLTPILVFIPSFYEGQFWLYGANVVLDTIALVSSTFEAKRSLAILPTFEAGVKMITSIEAVLHYPLTTSHAPRELTPVTRDAFETSCERLARAGATLKADREQVWHEFIAMRARYKGAVDWIAEVTLVPSTPWLSSWHPQIPLERPA